MTYTVILRGSPTRTTLADYYCEVHGRFELEVERTAAGDAPDEMPCPMVDEEVCCPDHDACGLPAVYCISAPLAKVRAIEAVKGEWSKPERETYTDTRNIGEGQALYDWKADREAVWERKRQRDVVAFAREHNERIRSDD